MQDKIISKELLSAVLGKKVQIRGCMDKFIPNNFEYIEDMINVKTINIHELALKIIDYATKNGYVASLIKAKEFWYCEYATESYYENNGILNLGVKDTKSKCPLESASIMGEYILKNKV